MAKRNRETLKNFFKKGALPSEEQFADLIDSTLNMTDEGLSKSPQNGLEITSQGNHETLATFFQGNDPERPTWSLTYGSNNESLLFTRRTEVKDAAPPLTITSSLDQEGALTGRVGVNTDTPLYDLDVQGVVRAAGRIGVNPLPSPTVPADGKWHDITDQLYGCHAFEIMAGVGKKKSGKYALMHAIAVNAFNPRGFFFNLFNLKKRIHCTQSYYYSRGDKLKLRWCRGTGDRLYTLQLRTNTDYGKGIVIQYSITRLWFDQDMHHSWEHQE